MSRRYKGWLIVRDWLRFWTTKRMGWCAITGNGREVKTLFAETLKGLKERIKAVTK